MILQFIRRQTLKRFVDFRCNSQEDRILRLPALRTQFFSVTVLQNFRMLFQHHSGNKLECMHPPTHSQFTKHYAQKTSITVFTL